MKSRIEQALLLRGSSDFPDIEAYQAWLDELVAAINAERSGEIARERKHLCPLPSLRSQDYEELMINVPKTSVLSVKLVIYSVPSRLIGERLRVHLYNDRLTAYAGTEKVLDVPRIYPQPGKPLCIFRKSWRVVTPSATNRSRPRFIGCFGITRKINRRRRRPVSSRSAYWPRPPNTIVKRRLNRRLKNSGGGDGFPP